MKKITVMTPCFNEESGISDCYFKVKDFFENSLPSYNYEHLFIDNCSTDNTVEILRSLAKSDKRLKVIVNSRNFGPNQSPYYAILQSEGDAVIPFVADLQMPVESILDFVKLWEAGYDMVMGLRVGMSESMWLRWSRDTYYNVMGLLSNFDHYHGFIGFGLFDRKTVEAMKKINTPNPYFRTIVSEIGFKKAFVEYHQPPRSSGKSRLKFSDLLDYAVLGVVSSSKKPLRFMTVMGLIAAGFSFLGALIYFIFKLLFWNTFAIGLAPVLIGMFFLGAIQIFCLGLLGEYVGVIFDYVRDRPLVIEKERINFD
jgi:glycosyltransferase involved in cell wall biosynthesis